MAVAPVFIASLAEMHQRLRLSKLPTGGDAEVIVNQAVTRARLDLYRQLGTVQVTKLLTYAAATNPTTEKEILRSLAGETEVMMAQFHLLKTLPTMTMDGGTGQAMEMWNDEAPFRDTSQSEREDMCKRLESMIIENIDLLKEDETIGSEVSIRCGAFSPDADGVLTPAPIKPGSTVWDYPET